MKHDHTFTFTAAVVIAGVVLAFVNPADATNTTAPLASAIETSIVAPNSANVVAAVAKPAALHAKRDAKHKGDCERANKADPRA